MSVCLCNSAVGIEPYWACWRCQGLRCIPPTWSFDGVGAAGICDIGSAEPGAAAAAASAFTISLLAVDILLVVCAIFFLLVFLFEFIFHLLTFILI